MWELFMNNRKKIVITGASGFLGRHLVERLKDDEQYKVYTLSSKPDILRDKIGGKNVSYYHKDVLSADMLENSIVINCAYPRNSTGMAIADGLKYIKMVFERAAEAGASAIINISSQSVYSQQRTDAATEETPVSLESSYAVGKYAVELILESICRGSNTVFTNLRMASLIGPEFDQRIVNRFVKQALETGTLNVKRNQKKFGFFDVEDAVDRIVAMLGSKKMTWKHVYNLGRDGAYTLIGIAETVKDVVKGETGKQIEIIVTDGDEIGNSELNVRSFEKDFGPFKVIDLRDSVKRICESERL